MTYPDETSRRDPDQAARDEANSAVRGALHRMGRAAGATFTEQPIFEGARTTEQVMDPVAAIAMGVMLRSAVEFQLSLSVRRARSAGAGWSQIGEALGPQADRDRGISLAEAAYEQVTDAERARPFDRLSFYFTCSACGQHVTDRGPYNAHPLDNEEGHAESCPRLLAAIAEHDAQWAEDAVDEEEADDEC